MITTILNDRERLTKDFEEALVYFAHRQKKAITKEEVADISKRVMANIDIKNSSFAHKGASSIAREIINNRK